MIEIDRRTLQIYKQCYNSHIRDANLNKPEDYEQIMINILEKYKSEIKKDNGFELLEELSLKNKITLSNDGDLPNYILLCVTLILSTVIGLLGFIVQLASVKYTRDATVPTSYINGNILNVGNFVIALYFLMIIIAIILRFYKVRRIIKSSYYALCLEILYKAIDTIK